MEKVLRGAAAAHFPINNIHMRPRLPPLRLRSNAFSARTADALSRRSGLAWTDVYAETDAAQLISVGERTLVRNASGPGLSASLAAPILSVGTHRIRFVSSGEGLVVGVAAASPALWGARAWGLGGWSGCMHACPSAVEDGLVGEEVPLAQLADEDGRRALTMVVQVGEHSSRLGFEIADGAAEPFTSKLLLPPGPLRPWALFTSEGGGGAPGASLSLLGYSGDGGPGLNLPLPAQRQSQREAVVGRGGAAVEEPEEEELAMEAAERLAAMAAPAWRRVEQ